MLWPHQLCFLFYKKKGDRSTNQPSDVKCAVGNVVIGRMRQPCMNRLQNVVDQPQQISQRAWHTPSAWKSERKQ
jgi:spore germination cell wall hydrolase CwlJ-like protein